MYCNLIFIIHTESFVINVSNSVKIQEYIMINNKRNSNKNDEIMI